MADIANLNVIIGANIDAFERSMRAAEAGIGRLGQGLKSAGAGLSAAITLPLGILGGAALAASAQIDALRRGLQAVTQQQLGEQGITGVRGIAQAATDTKARLLELRQVAALPGLGFAEAIQGDIRLRAVGISADLSKRALLAFGNAIATTGGGKSELDRVTVQLGQLSAKGKVLAQDLRPIIEAAPAVATAGAASMMGRKSCASTLPFALSWPSCTVTRSSSALPPPVVAMALPNASSARLERSALMPTARNRMSP